MARVTVEDSLENVRALREIADGLVGEDILKEAPPPPPAPVEPVIYDKEIRSEF